MALGTRESCNQYFLQCSFAVQLIEHAPPYHSLGTRISSILSFRVYEMSDFSEFTRSSITNHARASRS